MTYSAMTLRGGCALAVLALGMAEPAPAQQADPSAATASQTPADTAAGDDAGAPDIVVTGTRLGQRKAIGEKREADNVVEALYANDVGKLPDQNVAEAVKRLPGISVANDQGEGRYVIIRGIDPNLVNVTLNGQTLPAPEPDSRQVKLDDLPSAMINAVIVSKSLLASQDANAIGGEVNIETLTAFDRKERFFLDARGALGWYEINHKKPYELDGQIGGRFGNADQFGAVLSVNYSRRPIESENFQGSEGWAIPDAPGEKTNSYIVPDDYGLRDYNLVRTRLGVVGNFDWRPSDAVKLWLRTSYSKFTDNENRDQNRLAVDGPVTETSATTGSFDGAPTILVRHREEDDNTKSATLGGSFELGGGAKLAVSGGWTKATKTDPLRSEYTFKASDVPVTYDLGTYPYTFSATNDVFADPTAFKLSKYNLETRQASEELWQGRADLTIPVAIGDGSTLAFGIKDIDRRKRNNQDKTDYKNGDAWKLDTVSYLGDTGFYDGMFPFGQRIDYFAARAYADANPGVLKIDPAGTLADTLSSDYDVRENILAGYAMATLKFGGLTLIPGIRVEHTHDETKAKVVDNDSALGDGFNSFGEKSYTDVFPGLTAKYEFPSGVTLRAAVTTAIGRPAYPQLAPYVVVEDDDVPSISIGNPDLKPYKAVNLDGAVEYYASRDSLFSLGLFYKHIDNPIYSLLQLGLSGTFGGVAYGDADVTQPVNAQDEIVGGVEVNAQYQFTSLPGFLGGFGISANYTHVEGHARAPGIRAGKIPLFFQSHDIGTAQIFFEKYGFAARVAYTYRSKYLDALGGDAASDEYTDTNGQLDVHASYEVTPQVTIFADGTNLTDAPWRRFIGTNDQLVERERYSYSLRGGVQVHF